MMKKKRMKAIIILSAILVVLLIGLILLVVNIQGKKYVIPEEPEVIDDINIEDITPTDYYTKLMYVYLLNSNKERSIVLIPNDFEQNDFTFNNQFESLYLDWRIDLSTNTDIDACFEALDDYTASFEGIEIVAEEDNGNNRYRILKYDDTTVECHYFLVTSNDISMYLVFSFNPSEIDQDVLDTIKQLKEVYQIDELELPDLDIPVDPNLTGEEMDELYGE